jgi:hypothetical protein
MTARRATKANSFTRQARVRALAPKFLRLSGFVLVLFLILWGMAIHRARAEVGELMSGIGAEMMRYADASFQDRPRALHLNGQALGFESGSSHKSPAEVLDYYQARCAEAGGHFADLVREVDNAPSMDERGWTLLDGTLRESNERGGYVACFDMGGQSVGIQGLVNRISSFVATGDLSRVGGFRYVFVQPGESDTTHFVTFHTDEGFNVYEMFPRSGDAPGVDIEGMPRPEATRRLMSAWEQGDPHLMNVYSVEGQSAPAIESWYLHELPVRGWQASRATSEQVELFTQTWSEQHRAVARNAHYVLATKGDQEVLAVFTDRSGGSNIAMLTQRASGTEEP